MPFGFLGRCLPTSLPAEVRIQILPIPRRSSLELLQDARASAEAELATGPGGAGRLGSELEVERESAEELSHRIAAGEQELWRFGMSLHALGTSLEGAERTRGDLARRLRTLGFHTRVPDFEASLATQAPDLSGHEPRPSGYWHTLPTDGVAAFFPFVDETVGEPGGILVGLHLEDASPVFVDRWSQSSHSWGLFGATGSGKTFASALWTLRSRWMSPGLSLYYLDPFGEFAGLARLLGGRVITVGPGEPSRWNPLEAPSGQAERLEKAARVARLLRLLFPTLTDEEGVALDTALTGLYARDPGSPTFSDLLESVERMRSGPPRLHALLEVLRSGSLSHLNGPSNVSFDGSPVAVNLAGIPPERLPFHLAYLLDVLLSDLRRRPGPKLVVVDEAHLLARDGATAELLDTLVRSVRHYQAGLLLISQNPDDFLATESGRSTLRNLRATVLLHLPQVSDAAGAFFGLTAAEREWLPRARLPREAGYAEGLLRLGPAHLPIALVASTPEYELLQGSLGRRRPGP